MDSMYATFKTDGSLEDKEIPPAPWSIKVLFFIYKGINAFYCAFFFYFFPLYFTIIPVSELIIYTSRSSYTS